MKVILIQTVAKLGKAGQVVTVKDGYARNFLFPRGLATLAEKRQIAALERRHAKSASKMAETKAGAETVKEKLDGKVVKIQGKVGADMGKLFGAVTAQNVADAVKDQLGMEVEKRQVALHEPIKRLGKHAVMIDLHRDVDAWITVHVFDPEHPEVEEATAAPAESAPAEEPVAVEA